MPRQSRSCPGGYVYHVWNRAAGRLKLFKKPEDYHAFERVMIDAHERYPLRLLDWCLMPNHWHFVVYPKGDDEVTAFFRWLTHTHSMRVHVARGMVGLGPLYQGRFKTLPVQRDEHLLTLLRYVERNPVRAKLARRAAQWRHGSESVRQGTNEPLRAILSEWPVERPRQWSRYVDEAQTNEELVELRMMVKRSRPFGDADWTKATAERIGLQWTMKPLGRPRKTE